MEYRLEGERVTFVVDEVAGAPGYVSATGRDPQRPIERSDTTSDWTAEVGIGAMVPGGEEALSVSFMTRVDALGRERRASTRIPLAVVVELLRRRGYSVTGPHTARG
jgi:hypothetical protein